MAAPKGHPNYDTEGLAGRPKKYDDAFIEQEAAAFLDWMKDPKSLWYEDFASQRGYSPARLTEWSKINERFSDVYKQSQAWQKSLLIRGGLLNKFNSSITKLVLANTCGWTDKVESKLSGDAANPLAFVLQQIDGATKDLMHDDSED